MAITNTQIIALITVFFPFLIALAGHLYNMLLTQLPKNRQAQLTSLAQDAVHATEQLASGQSAAAKKQAATDILVRAAKTFGISVSPELISASIEAAVYAMNSSPAKLMQTDITKQDG